MFSFLRAGLEEVGARGHADGNSSEKRDIPNINSGERDPVSARLKNYVMRVIRSWDSGRCSVAGRNPVTLCTHPWTDIPVFVHNAK